MPVMIVAAAVAVAAAAWLGLKARAAVTDKKGASMTQPGLPDDSLTRTTTLHREELGKLAQNEKLNEKAASGHVGTGLAFSEIGIDAEMNRSEGRRDPVFLPES